MTHRPRSKSPAVHHTARAELERAQQRLGLMVEASSLLGASLDYETTLRSVARLAIPQLADWCIIDVVEDDGSIRRMAVEHRDAAKADLAREVAQRPPSSAGTASRLTEVLLGGRSAFHPRLSRSRLGRVAGEALQLLEAIGPISVMIVPLTARERTLGAATFMMSESGRHYTATDLALAEELARQAALAIDNARLYGDAERARGEAEAANRTKDIFLATLAHELRSPLGAVLTWCHTLRHETVETRRARAVAAIENSARLQLRLVEDLLDVSRIASGKLILRMESADLATITEAAVAVARAAATAKDIRLDVRLDPVPPVRGDPARLQQVVGNLLSNALKFTPAGGQVSVVLKAVGSEVELAVSDTGKGIAEHLLGDIFERFHQGESWTTGEYGGLGLGLALARHLVERHRGTITAESPGSGRGATFRVRLPAFVPDPERN
jgi:signal transduction histidine kinase